MISFPASHRSIKFPIEELPKYAVIHERPCVVEYSIRFESLGLIRSSISPRLSIVAITLFFYCSAIPPTKKCVGLQLLIEFEGLEKT